MSRRDAPAAVRWTAYVAVAIVFAIACAFLSNWQFTRNAERAGQLALVEANYDAEPVPLAEVIPPGEALAPEDEWTPVVLHGAYLADDELLVRNRAHGGTAAYEERRYGGPEPIFLETRKDRQSDLSAELSYLLRANTTVLGRVAYTDNRSNLPLTRFDRTVAGISLRLSFSNVT